jgi:general secretion pathway protein L
MLAALGSVVPAGKAASAIEFTSGEARLKGLQLDPGESDSVTTRLKTLGYALRPDGESLVLKQDTAP